MVSARYQTSSLATRKHRHHRQGIQLYADYAAQISLQGYRKVRLLPSSIGIYGLTARLKRKRLMYHVSHHRILTKANLSYSLDVHNIVSNEIAKNLDLKVLYLD